jgi:hypothetical protein
MGLYLAEGLVKEAIMIRAGLFSLLTAISAQAGAQLPPALVEVQRQAPHLVSFAGSPANFQNLVLGLTQSGTVTLSTPFQDGTAELASFSSSVPLGPSEVVAVLEQARQQLAAVGIVQPTAGQLGAALAGGPVNTLSTQAQLPGVMPRTGVTAGVRTQRFFVGVPGALPTPVPPGLAAPSAGSAGGSSIPNSPAFSSQTPGFPAAGSSFPSQAPAPTIAPLPVVPNAVPAAPSPASPARAR